jgi:hypothetical protein
MRIVYSLLVLAALQAALLVKAEAERLDFYVQLVSGSTTNKPPVVEAKRVGQKLSQKLQPVFNCEHYWELSQHHVQIKTGEKTRVQLDKQHAVEIDLREPGKRIVTSFRHGKQISRCTRPIGEAMTISGGDHDSQNKWFIVVRRDKPVN